VLTDRPREPTPHASTLRWIGATLLVAAAFAAALLLIRWDTPDGPQVSLESAIMRIAEHFDSPVGFEAIDTAGALTQALDDALEAGDAASAMELLTGRDRSRYIVERVGRAVEVRPITRFRSPFDTRVTRLPALSNTTLLVASNRILRAVTEGPALGSQRRRSFRLEGLDSETRIDIDVDNVPVARALTAAVEAHGRAGWLFTPCGRPNTWCFRMFTFDGGMSGITLSK
jgi:hypothetical protein